MKKVCNIYTFSNAPNFGALFQAIGSAKALADLGWKVQLVDPNGFSFYFKNPLKPQGFINLCRTLMFRNAKIKKQFKHNYLCEPDIVFIGSDQILNPSCLKDTSNKFINNPFTKVPNYCLAISALNSADLNYMDSSTILRLQSYKKITVRESWLASELRKHNLKVEVLPDPSFYIDKEYLNSLINKNSLKKNKFLIAGYNIANWKGLPKKAKYLNYNFRNILKMGFNYTTFYSSLSNVTSSENVFTNSYHFLIVSLITGKKIYIPKEEKIDGGPRVKELLSSLAHTKSKNFYIIDSNLAQNCNFVLKQKKKLIEFFLDATS